jgi:hypothetical protein
MLREELNEQSLGGWKREHRKKEELKRLALDEFAQNKPAN